MSAAPAANGWPAAATALARRATRRRRTSAFLVRAAAGTVAGAAVLAAARLTGAGPAALPEAALATGALVGAVLGLRALRALVRPFADPDVGAVSSEDVIEAAGGEGAYVRYEMALRTLESEATTLVGLSGSCFAIRRALGEPWPPDLASDFRCALEAARRGMRAVSEPEARVRFGVVRTPAEEWARKVRTVRRGLAVLSAYRGLLDPRHGRVSIALWSHKVARFTSPFALLVLLAASAFAAPASPLAAVLLAAQLVVYGAGCLALVARPLASLLPARIAAFFVLVNASMLVAWGHHLRGRRAVLWQPTRR